MLLRDYQTAAVRFASTWLSTAKPGDKLLLASPTGTGKSYTELAIQAEIPGACIVAPRLEIIQSLLEKSGVNPHPSQQGLISQAESLRVFTPMRLRSALLSGSYPVPPLLIFDEAHHDLASTWQDIHLLCGFAPAIGLTASPFRGTPKSTLAFREQWGEPQWIITFPEAVARKALSLPVCRTVPLVDDDEIEITNGELVAKQVNSAVESRLGAVADIAGEYCSEAWDRPTMFSLPSRELCYSLATALESKGIPSVVVTGETPYSERQTAFRACVDCSAALIQVYVVSEGVDLPIRRLIDLAPTLSPVKWLQQFGRITRPSFSGSPEYICTNRNLLRHGYLLDGCLPIATMMQAQAAFPASSRAGIRAVGLEALGRLKPVDLPLKGGLKALAYSMSCLDGHVRTDYFVFVHPLHADPLWAMRESVRTGGDAVSYGRWHRCEPPNDLSGFASLPPSSLSEKQEAWWKRCAAGVGLDPDAKINKKQFPALPVLYDMKVRLS